MVNSRGFGLAALSLTRHQRHGQHIAARLHIYRGYKAFLINKAAQGAKPERVLFERGRLWHGGVLSVTIM